VDPGAKITRNYRGHTLILDTTIETADGVVIVTDFMRTRTPGAHLIRLVRGISGSVKLRTELIIRFDYGSVVPWVRRCDDGSLQAVAGPNRLILRAPLKLRPHGRTHVGEFIVTAGETTDLRAGNAATGQLQLDIYGEVLDALYQSRKRRLVTDAADWMLQIELLKHLEKIWELPDEGIWEVRGRRRHFTYSKVMAWVAFDRAVKSIEEFGFVGPLDHWRHLRQHIHDDICAKGFDPEQGVFTQSYGGKELDASLLMMALVGFLPPEDKRLRDTVEAIEQRLMVNGFVRRYDTQTAEDGLPAGEGAFLACSFWLVDNLVLSGRCDDARGLFERLLALRNDLGLLSEEYDIAAKRLVGNFPQAFSHIALINSAYNLAHAAKPAEQRSGTKLPEAGEDRLALF
jgi:GH15 family glucan-1,4-alpha-glucosidase